MTKMIVRPLSTTHTLSNPPPEERDEILDDGWHRYRVVWPIPEDMNRMMIYEIAVDAFVPMSVKFDLTEKPPDATVIVDLSCVQLTLYGIKSISKSNYFYGRITQPGTVEIIYGKNPERKAN